MNRFKKTMALTAACVIAATAVNVGGVAYAGGGSLPASGQAAGVATEEEANITAATVDGHGNKVIEITLSNKTIHGDINENAKSRFVVTRTNSNKGIVSIEKKGENKIRLTLAEAIAPAEPISVAYNTTDGDENTKIKLGATVYLKAFTAQSVTNNVEETAKLEELTASVNADKKTIVITAKKDLVGANVEQIKDQFAVNGEDQHRIDSVAVQGKDITIVLNGNDVIKYGEAISIEYTLKKDDKANTIKSEDKRVDSFVIASENVDVSKVTPLRVFEIVSVKKVPLEKDEKTTSKIHITFKTKAPAVSPGQSDVGIPLLAAKSISIVGAKVKAGKEPTKVDEARLKGTVYEIEIENVISSELTVNVNVLGDRFEAEGNNNKVAVDYVAPPSTGGGSTRSSVRPDSSTPSKKEEVKKEEPKKEEPKKEEAKKDEMANAPKSAEKVSTKLVIGQKTYTAMVNGQAVEKTMDVAPMVHQGRTVLPARMISELLGVDVKFDQASKTASFMYGEGNKVELTLGQKFMMVNGEKVALTADILNKDGRILLPVTDIQKAFAKLGLEATVSWDAATKSVTIEK